MNHAKAVEIMAEYVALDATLAGTTPNANRVTVLAMELDNGVKLLGSTRTPANHNDIIRTAAATCWETPNGQFPTAEILTAAAAWSN